MESIEIPTDQVTRGMTTVVGGFFTNPFESSKWESSLRKVEKYMKPPPGSVRKHERFLLLTCQLPTSCLQNFAVRMDHTALRAQDT